ncbi:hypothetical protein SBOR_5466 [Sclerotinia borealis F-4128]|uniref:Ankyrin repeat protein n=1 Tax=Sclerotinia borealis (strain F-4128) TaxID=1432307 RepID=W9CHW8_SCLBF|nr:hypothetical protein SBOR_5466 [Sclerotinia borealis F-4128]
MPVVNSRFLNPYYNPLAHWDSENILPRGGPTPVFMPELSCLYSTQLDLPHIQDSVGDNPPATEMVSLLQAQVEMKLWRPQQNMPWNPTLSYAQNRSTCKEYSNLENRQLSWISGRTQSTRISSHSSNSSRHAKFYRSNLISAMSVLSRGSSISRNSQSVSDQEWWTMAVDDSEMTVKSSPDRCRFESARSLFHRRCCGLKLPLENWSCSERCSTCGFAIVRLHHIARTGQEMLPLNSTGDIVTQDNFGNTALHHAAAAGNIQYIEHVLKFIKPHTVLSMGSQIVLERLSYMFFESPWTSLVHAFLRIWRYTPCWYAGQMTFMERHL